MTCCSSGPGYASPLEAMKGPREKILYIPCINPKYGEDQKPDFLSTIDVDPNSPDYSKIIHRLMMPYIGDELHHSGWNVCSNCHDQKDKFRNRLILPCLTSDRIYVVSTENERQPEIHSIIEPEEMHSSHLSAPHTVHCIPSGDILISCMGDEKGDKQGSFALIDGKTLRIKSNWSKDKVPFGYDFGYKPRHNVMISSEWGEPNAFRKGLDLKDVVDGRYGHSLHIWDWNEKKYLESIDLGTDGMMSLETRFLHNPDASEGFVGCALNAIVYRFYKSQSGKWKAEKVIEVPPKTVKNWILDKMPGVLTDLLISLDDKYLYFSNWVHGDIRQYDIKDPKNPKLAGQIFIGGSISSGGQVKVLEDQELDKQPDALYVKGKRVEGGPQMLQLSLDGKRLYVTTSLFSVWDRMFYPNLVEKGSVLLQIDVNTETGGLKLNENFFVDFDPYLAHEVRYPGGDCTSDIWC